MEEALGLLLILGLLQSTSNTDVHPVFECQGLQYIRDKYPGLFGQDARTMVQFMWQADMHGVAQIVTDCLGVYSSTDPDGDQASDQP